MSDAYERPVYLISHAARLAGMHAQTLRTYDRLGLVVPSRAAGRGRRYSLRDVDKLLEIQRLSQEEGINLAGIARIFALVEDNEKLRSRLDEVLGIVGRAPRVFSASPTGDIEAIPQGTRPPVRPHGRLQAPRALTARPEVVRTSTSAIVVWQEESSR